MQHKRTQNRKAIKKKHDVEDLCLISRRMTALPCLCVRTCVKIKVNIQYEMSKMQKIIT